MYIYKLQWYNMACNDRIHVGLCLVQEMKLNLTTCQHQ